ncbi:hypothetical protein MGSAQ_002787, partial [marine sediment metagenome]
CGCQHRFLKIMADISSPDLRF